MGREVLAELGHGFARKRVVRSIGRGELADQLGVEGLQLLEDKVKMVHF